MDWRKLLAPLGLPLIAALMVAIFILDTITDLEIAVAVLYVAVILLAARLPLSTRGILLVAALCGGATILSFVLTPRGAETSGLINACLSIVAIAATTYLSVTIRRTVESERQARSDLARAAQAASLGELAATIAHEINQPLGALGANASAVGRWLASQPPNLERASEAVAAISADANRAGEIVRRIRSLAAGAPVERELLDINGLVTGTAALLREELQGKRIGLRVELADELPLVRGDRLQLQQVFLNLLANASEAMETTTGASGEIVIRSSRPNADYVVVTVQDNGSGIDPEKAAKLFDAFYSTKAAGMGLGLSICRTLVEAHGGKIWFEPLQHGAMFKFALPIERPQTATIPVTQAP